MSDKTITNSSQIEDLVEKPIAQMLERLGIEYEHDNIKSSGLDFYLPSYDIYIECKQFFSERIYRQTRDKRNVIVVQGQDSATFLEQILANPTKEITKEEII